MLASATYDPDAPLPEGYRRATDADLQAIGLSDGETSLLDMPGEPDFHAEAFVRTAANGSESYVVGFKGTSFTSLSDWRNNLGQGMGSETSYYRRAARIGRQAMNSGHDISFVGHSLGGGLAATASGAGGLPAQTFNSAGLSQATLDRIAFENPSLVSATHVEGDILNGLQDNTPMADAYGTRRGIPPASGWTFGDVAGGAVGAVAGSLLGGNTTTGGLIGAYGTRGVRLHGMESVEEALEHEEDMLREEMDANGC